MSADSSPAYIIRKLYPEAADKLMERFDETGDLSVRAINCCLNAGLVHVYDLLRYSPQELLDARMSGDRKMFGQKTVDELVAHMESIGAPLKPNTVTEGDA